MKLWKSLLLFVLFSMFFHFNCSKNDNSANPADQSSFTGLGSDYLPITADQSFKGTVSGSRTLYDSLGGIITSDSWTGKQVEAKIGAPTTRKNQNVNPILGFNERRGRFDIVGYLYNIGDLMGMNINPDPHEVNGLLLPKEFKIGQEWIVNSAAKAVIPKIKVKAAEAMASYVTSSGKTYNNVVKFDITSSDSVTHETYIHYFSVITERRALSASIYLAKGIGLVDAKLDNYSVLTTGTNYINLNRIEKVYFRSVIKGALGL